MRTAEFITPNNSDKLCDIVSDTLYDYFKSIDSQTNCVLETLYNNKSLNINGFLKINKSILLIPCCRLKRLMIVASANCDALVNNPS